MILNHVETGVSAVTKQSCIMYGVSRRRKYYEYLPYAMISVILTKKSQEEWRDEDLFPDPQHHPIPIKRNAGLTVLLFWR